jgi:hypothetical protein
VVGGEGFEEQVGEFLDEGGVGFERRVDVEE